MKAVEDEVKGVSSVSSWVDAIRSIMFLVWCQSVSTRKVLMYIVYGSAVFLGSYFLVLNGESSQFEGWFFEMILFRAIPLLALALSGELLRNEIRDGTIEYLWTRPASRSQLLVSFFSAAFFKSLVCGIVLLVVVFFAGLLKGSEPEFGFLLGGVFALFFSALAFCAGGTLLAALTGKYMVWGVIYGVVIEQ